VSSFDCRGDASGFVTRVNLIEVAGVEIEMV
jgi:hypothetical protein